MTDVTGGPASNATPSRRDLEELGTETSLNGVSSGDDRASLDDELEGRSFGASTDASASGAFAGGVPGEGDRSDRARLLQDGKDVASAKAQQARQWAGEISSRQTEAFRQRVVEKPVETSVAVFGVGLIVGLLLRR